MTEEPLKLGLLLEAAEAHQKMAEQGLRQLSTHTAGLDAVVREAVRVALTEDLAEVFTESARAAHALRQLGRAAQLRVTVWTGLTAIVVALAPLTVLHLLVPSRAEVADLEQRRDALVAAMRELQDVHADLRRCDGRPCVRVDRQAGAWGENADYFVLKAR
jgi:hypothetical protein